MAVSLRLIPFQSTVRLNNTKYPTAVCLSSKAARERNLRFSVDPKEVISTGSKFLFSPGLGRHSITPSAISGSPGTASSMVSEDTTRMLDSVEVLDLNGKAIPISDLWKDRKAVVAFARHFGCVLCRRRADFLASKKDRMDASGVALVLIGPEVYADPSHSSYKALSFVSGISTTFTPGAGLKIIQSYMEGYRQDWELSFEKDTRTRGGWQQGGIIVAGPGKSNISYIHKDKEAGDDPDIEDVLKACCS
ncbi:thioredoxin-like protein AAED1, chloroplastic isoform X2 [Macadamia integrifolia]|uniref:thioredoxin-like protein AAED1, chloroplastic isoform X2 n=1 Tax=Macadamia integrifolia TaxID=60698 RepID=UPI001C52AAF1|nr:thioredoxin-like protein AAED1, chloroplastic isoform X2 [Macadamia integrifolia]